MLEELKLLPRYILSLGPIHGFFLFIQVELLNKSRIQLPRYEKAIFLRKGTSDKKVFREVFLFKIYNFPWPDNPPKIIIDAGANIGLSSIFFANRFPDAMIIAVEPETCSHCFMQNHAMFDNNVAKK